MRHLLSILAAVVMIPTVSSAATVVIDDFDNGYQFVEDPILTAFGVNTSSVDTISALGGTRNMVASATGGAGGARNVEGEAGPPPDGTNHASVSLDTDVAGFVMFEYGVDAAVSGPYDLVDGTNDRFSLNVTDTDGVTVSFHLWVADGDSSDFVMVDVNSVGEVVFNFSDFTGIDFTSVTSIALTVAGVAADIQFDDFIATSQVPVPAGLPLLLAGLGAFGVVARRRKRAS